jgi:hypothetical protein
MVVSKLVAGAPRTPTTDAHASTTDASVEI